MVAFDLRRLRLLRELEERGTLAAVATALGYTPSAISQQLSVLEKEVGVRLLDKAGRGVRLTDAGRLLSRHAGDLLAAADAARADLASLTGEVRGTVRAGGLQSATRRLLIPAVARVRADHPHVRLEISELELEQALPELRLGALDLVISDEYEGHPRPRPAGLTFEPLHEEPLKLVLPAAHPCAEHGGPVAMTALEDDVWVASATGTGHHALVVGSCRALGGYEPDLRHRSNDADVQLELVRTTGAVALMPALALPAIDPALAIRDITEAAITRRLMIITREKPHGTRPQHLPDNRPRTGAPNQREVADRRRPRAVNPASPGDPPTGRSPTARTRRPRRSSAGSRSSTCPHARRREWSRGSRQKRMSRFAV